MLTFDDCLEMSELSEDEIRAIAEHEHIPEICALELGDYLCHHKGGSDQIRKFILDDIANAEKNGNTRHAEELRKVLEKFTASHPEKS